MKENHNGRSTHCTVHPPLSPGLKNSPVPVFTEASMLVCCCTVSYSLFASGDLGHVGNIFGPTYFEQSVLH